MGNDLGHNKWRTKANFKVKKVKGTNEASGMNITQCVVNKSHDVQVTKAKIKHEPNTTNGPQKLKHDYQSCSRRVVIESTGKHEPITSNRPKSMNMFLTFAFYDLA